MYVLFTAYGIPYIQKLPWLVSKLRKNLIRPMILKTKIWNASNMTSFGLVKCPVGGTADGSVGSFKHIDKCDL